MDEQNRQAQQPAGASSDGRSSRRFWSGFGAGIGTILLLVLGVIGLMAVVCAVAMSRGCTMGGDMMDREMMGEVQDADPAHSPAAGAAVRTSTDD